ncbi:DDE-type integrase/transposase/recombinase [Corynebacterium pseudodiphtheriticum]|uniref:DDE-type integrase/transposase/recombinase n=1 Tax=Corynebacterium pseudodiphtheriticum TaxID=37637 RepID=UPI0032B79312
MKNNRVGGFITSRGYRQSKARGPSARLLRDAVLVERIGVVHRNNYGVYGVRKMWHALRREGIDIGREHTARLMRLAGVSGKGKGGSPMTTRKAHVPDLCPDLVEREFKAQGPNKLWVADVTYVRTRKGFVYTAFVTDVYSRRIVGWALSDSMRTSSTAAASSQPGDPSVLRKQQVLFIIRITARSMSALSTTSDLPSTGSLLPPELLSTEMTMLWLKT